MTSSNQSATVQVDTVEPAATLELLGTGYILDSPRAALTPAIKAGLKDLEVGEVLLLRTDHPTAGLDIPAWCALTGNVLQATSVEDDGVIRFLIRKESKRRWCTD